MVKFAKTKISYPTNDFSILIPKNWYWKVEKYDNKKIILGIDPGTSVMGYGIIHIKGKKIEMLNFGVINLSKLPSHPDKLKLIFDRVDGLIREYLPDEMAIEAPFLLPEFSDNPR